MLIIGETGWVGVGGVGEVSIVSAQFFCKCKAVIKNKASNKKEVKCQN